MHSNFDILRYPSPGYVNPEDQAKVFAVEPMCVQLRLSSLDSGCKAQQSALLSGLLKR